MSDNNVPASRSMTYLVESEENLDALEYLLRMPDDEELRGYREEAESSRRSAMRTASFSPAICMEWEIP